MVVARARSHHYGKPVLIRKISGLSALAVALSSLALTTPAMAADDPTGGPPPDATALVAAPKSTVSAPTFAKALDGTTAALSSGGQLATGNSRLLAATANGQFDQRFGANELSAAVLANYGEGAPPGMPVVTSAENLQARFRYDRYLTPRFGVFLIDTFRHDRFQGLDVRYNVDPGLRYLFVDDPATSVGAEVGYDFQADVRLDSARVVLDPTTMMPVLPEELLPKTATDHSVRLFLGFHHSFNKEVTLSGGVEYLQSVLDSQRSRVNFDALFAAKVSGGLAVGLGFSARYDNDPLPGKVQLDTATTVTIIYSFSSVVKPPPPPPPCPAK